jgi:hypothetical protein
MIDLKKVTLKKDHYEFEIVLEHKNCEVLQVTDDHIFIKPRNFNKINELKQDIIKMVNKNPELYCDCKKVLYHNLNDTFEEVLKVKTNGIEISPGEKYNINILVYGIWFSNRSSYGPMVKVLECKNNNSETVFIPDPDEYNSDEEINDSLQHYAKMNQFKKKNIKNVKKDKNGTLQTAA